jgi:hypothetical protein
MFLTSSNTDIPHVNARWVEELLRKRGRDARSHRRRLVGDIDDGI